MVHCLDTASFLLAPLGHVIQREGELLPTLNYFTRTADMLLRTRNIASEVQLGKLRLNEFLVKAHLLLPKWAAARFATAWAVAILAWITVLYASAIEYMVDYQVISTQLSESCECLTCLCFCSEFHHSSPSFLADIAGKANF